MSFRRLTKISSQFAPVILLPALMAIVLSTVEVPSEDISEKMAGGKKLAVPAYLLVSTQKSKISVRIGSTVLREYQFTILGDSTGFTDMNKASVAAPTDTLFIDTVHLTAAAKAVSSSILAIIAEETQTDPAHIQRYIPGEMVMCTDRGLRIYVSTDCENPEQYRREQFKELFRRAWHGIMRRESIHLRLSAQDAMSLYGIAQSYPRLLIR